MCVCVCVCVCVCMCVYVCVCISARANRKVYSGLRTRIGRRVTRSWDKYEGRPRFFSARYRTATMDHSGWAERPGWGLDFPQYQVSPTCITGFSSGTF